MTQKSDPDIDKSQDLLYTISEVAALLKVNRNYVYKLINKGYLRSINNWMQKSNKKTLLQFLEQNDGMNFDEIDSFKSAE